MAEHSARPLILLVEDEPAITTALARLLDRWGFDVVAARTAVEAWAVLAGTPADLLIVDYKLPDVRGNDLYVQLVHEYPRLERRTLFITGDLAEPSLQAIEATHCPYLLKPFELGILVHELRALLDPLDQPASSERRTDVSAA